MAAMFVAAIVGVACGGGDDTAAAGGESNEPTAPSSIAEDTRPSTTPASVAAAEVAGVFLATSFQCPATAAEIGGSIGEPMVPFNDLNPPDRSCAFTSSVSGGPAADDEALQLSFLRNVPIEGASFATTFDMSRAMNDQLREEDGACVAGRYLVDDAPELGGDAYFGYCDERSSFPTAVVLNVPGPSDTIFWTVTLSAGTARSESPEDLRSLLHTVVSAL